MPNHWPTHSGHLWQIDMVKLMQEQPINRRIHQYLMGGRATVEVLQTTLIMMFQTKFPADFLIVNQSH